MSGNESNGGGSKRMMFVNRRPPHGSIHAVESLEVVLISAAFDQQVCMAFLDDGVMQLMKGQDTAGIGIKNHANAYGALGDYDVTQLYVERESLDERGLNEDDLMPLTWEDEDDDWAEKPSIRIVARDELAMLMDEQDVVFTF